MSNDLYLPITGTFLDEVSHDIENFNWDEEAWDKDFAAMKASGIDMATVIRCGTERWTMYPSAVLEKAVNAYRPPMDLMDIFMRLGEKHGIKIWVGTYFSNHDWLSAAYDVEKETDLMKRVCDEIWEKYGKSPAFGGWYLSQEIAGRISFNVVKCYQILGSYLKNMTNLPCFISPGIMGCNTGVARNPSLGVRKRLAVTPEEHEADWDWIMGEIAGSVDAICFQNSHIGLDQLEEFMQINHSLALKHGIKSWANLETFDILLNPHPPIKLQHLLMKLEAAKKVGFEKGITFEFSHYMSPNSEYGAARNLHKLYCKTMNIDYPFGK